MIKNHAASIKAKLLKLSKESQGETFNIILSRYVRERFLYRLGNSQYSNKFVLKGATLFTIWYGEPHRPTKDLDLLGYCLNEIPNIEKIFKEVCRIHYEQDGVVFCPETVKGIRIKEEQDYEGVRLTIKGRLEKAELAVQVDIGFGDAISPELKLVEFPTILDLASTKLQAYPPETVVAEKFQAMVNLGMANSRVKDFYDIWFLAQKFPFQGSVLRNAMKKTFKRRKTPLPSEEPLALTQEFYENPEKQKQWEGFLKKGKLQMECKTLSYTITNLKQFLLPVCLAALSNTEFDFTWSLDKQTWV